MGKSNKKVNPRNQPVTMAAVKRAKKDAVREATMTAWAIMFTVLRDKEGHTLEDLKRIWHEVDDLSDSIVQGYCTVSDLRTILKEEEGANIV